MEGRKKLVCLFEKKKMHYKIAAHSCASVACRLIRKLCFPCNDTFSSRSSVHLNCWFRWPKRANRIRSSENWVDATHFCGLANPFTPKLGCCTRLVSSETTPLGQVQLGVFKELKAASVWAPCLCLCLGLALQITNKRPLRLTNMQKSQIFFTEDFTFMFPCI